MSLLQRLALSLLLLSFCRIATAEPEDVRTVYKRAETAYALGRFADAAQLFEKTFELRQDPIILYNAAQAHRLAGNKQRALVLYQNYLRLFGEQDNRDIVEKRIADLKAAIEAERVSSTSPPMELSKTQTLGADNASPETKPAPAATPELVVTQPPPPKKKSRAWVWGVVGGSIVVAGAAVALGVALGMPGTPPAATLGTVKAN